MSRVRGLALVCCAALAASGCGGGSRKPLQPPKITNFAFDSADEVRHGEAEADEAVIIKQQSAEQSTLDEEVYAGAETPESVDAQIKSTKCVLDPPPPDAHQMTCRIAVAVAADSDPKRLSRWKVVLHLNEHTGALSETVSKLANTA